MAGLALGAASTLPALYTTCVQGFNHVQAARSFGADFERAQLRLDPVQLRFSRWGKSTMIDGSNREGHYRAAVASSPQENLAKNLLGQISAALEDAKKTVERYQLATCDGSTTARLGMRRGRYSALFSSASTCDCSGKAERNKFGQEIYVGHLR